VTIALIYLDALLGGGYPRDVRSLAGVLAERCSNVWLIAREGRHVDGLGAARILAPEKWRRLAGKIEIAHEFGILMPRQLLLQRKLQPAANVISPLGHLMEAHMKHRSWKKYPYLAIARRFLLPSQPTIHLFSEGERPGVVRHLHSPQCFEAPLGVLPAPATIEPARSSTSEYLLYFGRNDVHQKGIDVALEAYAVARRRGLRVPLLVAGAPHGDSERVIGSIVERLGLDESVTLMGRVDESEKWVLLRGARALVFLSRWDGPPRPIREALAVGTPVIVSYGTNLAALVSESCAGSAVELQPDAVADAMLHVANDAQVAQWREGAISLRARLAWNRVVDAYLDGYRLALAQ
jgi:glycosyltransferase involved in cell wall biosynthesis